MDARRRTTEMPGDDAEALRKESGDLVADAVELARENRRLRTEIERLKDAQELTSVLAEEHLGEIGQLGDAVRELTADLKEANAETERLREERDQYREELAEFNRRLTDALGREGEKRALVSKLRREVNEDALEVARLTVALSKRDENIGRLRGEVKAERRRVVDVVLETIIDLDHNPGAWSINDLRRAVHKRLEESGER